MSRRRVSEVTQKVSVITDVNMLDHGELDAYLQVICVKNGSMAEWRNSIKKNDVNIKCDVVWVMVGQAMLPWDEKLSPVNQMKKLLNELLQYRRRKFKKIFVGSIIPRPSKEIKYEADLREVNVGFKKAVREIRHLKRQVRGTVVTFVPTHKLVMERYVYFDMAAKGMASLLRVVRPSTVYFKPGGGELNAAGLQHVKSYMLGVMGFLDRDVNQWRKMPVTHESREIQEQKRKACGMVEVGGKHVGEIRDEPWSDDTDLDDEQPPPNVIVIQPGSNKDKRCVLPPKGGRRK